MRLFDLIAEEQGTAESDTVASAMGALAEKLTADVDWISTPPTPEEFLSNPYYVGALATDIDALPSPIRESWAKEADRKYNELLLCGGIGTYKTQRACLHLMYLACVYGHLHDPGAFYGLGSGASMTMAFVSTSKEKAKEVGYKRLCQFVYGSPWFMDHFRPDPKLTGSLKFPRGLTIKPVVSNESGILSDALLGLVLDEAAFLKVIDKSRLARGTDTTYDAAFQIYSQAKVRMTSRFHQNGKQSPCKIIIASSAMYPDDFVSRRRLEVAASKDPGVYVSDLAIWDAKEKGKYSEQRFRVEVGDEQSFPRILQDGEEPRPNARVIYPPMDFLPDFQMDLDRAIRDLGGVPLLTLAPFISDRAKVQACVRREADGFASDECVHPFPAESIVLGEKGGGLILDLISEIGKNGMRYPKRNKNALRYIHLDPSFGKQDAFGFAMVHVLGGDQIFYEDPVTKETKVKYSVNVYTDLVARIVRSGEPGSEINWADVEALISQLTEAGFDIARVTTDGVGAFLVQRLKTQGYDSAIQSVDRTIEPYLMLRSCLNEKRISFYNYGPLMDELYRLEWNKKRSKVDHPRSNNGAKDVADALCGAVYSAVMYSTEYENNTGTVKAFVR